jgi:hypothetical protein
MKINSESPTAFTTPLRLLNTNNSCYANCVVQVLIHLNHFFSDTIAREQDCDTTGFRPIYFKYLNDFKNNSSASAMSTSESLRQYVARYPNQPINHSYLDSSMQDSFLFFIDLINLWPEILRDRFKLLHNYKLTCECGHETLTNFRPAHQVTLRLNPIEPQTHFSNLFVNTTTYECEICKAAKPHSSYEYFRIPFECQFILLYVHNFNNFKQRINSILVGYNPDEMTLPCGLDGYIEKFMIRAAVIRIGDTVDSGHYYVWCRNRSNNGWTCLNDTEHDRSDTFPNNLQNVQYFVLEKISVNIASLSAINN